ncbi:hypothetical protein FB559_3125 [Actinoallomurus bryophytorum]|uniref:Uncharacterized protein n=1 Tax=Actinoallomurus bryophytorum TaxID=1490222 RepID=A0A543CKA7_9ACTN|nr:hypothetical protein FB559_3125 [Actinoallomurus bryophytorum]
MWCTRGYRGKRRPGAEGRQASTAPVGGAGRQATHRGDSPRLPSKPANRRLRGLPTRLGIRRQPTGRPHDAWESAHTATRARSSSSGRSTRGRDASMIDVSCGAPRCSPAGWHGASTLRITGHGRSSAEDVHPQRWAHDVMTPQRRTNRGDTPTRRHPHNAAGPYGDAWSHAGRPAACSLERSEATSRGRRGSTFRRERGEAPSQRCGYVGTTCRLWMVSQHPPLRAQGNTLVGPPVGNHRHRDHRTVGRACCPWPPLRCNACPVHSQSLTSQVGIAYAAVTAASVLRDRAEFHDEPATRPGTRWRTRCARPNRWRRNTSGREHGRVGRDR